MECKYPDCDLKGYAFDLIPTTGKPYACHNACPTMRKAELTAKDIMTIDPTRRVIPKDCGYPLGPHYDEHSGRTNERDS